jgi:hypothetical protein
MVLRVNGATTAEREKKKKKTSQARQGKAVHDQAVTQDGTFSNSEEQMGKTVVNVVRGNPLGAAIFWFWSSRALRKKDRRLLLYAGWTTKQSPRGLASISVGSLTRSGSWW